MADLVQQNMEDMVPELDAFKTLKIFDSDEIKHIIRIRKDYEFQIINNDPLISKKGYKLYISFEKQLDSIVKHRIKSLKITLISKSKVKPKKQWKRGRLINNNPIKSDPSKIARIAISRRIHFLYKRAINKFNDDNNLRIEYIIYCMKQGSHKKAEDGLWNVLSKRPNDINLWFYTASITMARRGIKPAINVLTRSIRIIHNIKLYNALINLQIEQSYLKYKNGDCNIDISSWNVITKYAIKKLPTHQVTLFILSLIDKICKIMISGNFRESLSNFDEFITNINNLLYEQSKIEPLLISYLWKIQITELMVKNMIFKSKNTFKQLFNDILSDCKNDCFKIYLFCALLFYTFNEGEFYTIDGIDNDNKYLLSFNADEMVNLFPSKTKLLTYYPEFLIISNLSPFISQPIKNNYINTCNILIKLKEFISNSLDFNWDSNLSSIIDHIIHESIDSTQLIHEKSICVTSILQVLKCSNKNYKHIINNLQHISSGLLTIFLMIEDDNIDSFKDNIRLKSFKITKSEESKLLIEKMLELTNNKNIIYELFNHFNDDLIIDGFNMLLDKIDLKDINLNEINKRLNPIARLRLCECIINKSIIKNIDINLIHSAHQNRVETMEILNIDRDIESKAWIEFIEFSKKIQNMLIKSDIPTPGVIYNRAVARLGPNIIN